MDRFNKESKDPNRDDIPSGLLRQRRNLLLISMTLLFVYYSGVQIEAAALTVFGADLSLSNPTVVSDFKIFWIAWAYFLIRYTQYIKFYGVMSDIASEYNDLLQPLYNRYFLSYLRDKYPSNFDGAPWVLPMCVKFNLRHGYRYITSGYLEPSAENQLKERKYSQEAFVEKLNFMPAFYCSAVAFFKLVTKSRHVTDYWLPYVVAAAPVCYLVLIA